MATKKSAPYKESVENVHQFGFEAVAEAPVSIVGSYVRNTSKDKGTDGYKVPIDEFDANNKDHKVYVMIDIDAPNYQEHKDAKGALVPGKTVHISLPALNGIPSFKEAIDVDGDSFSFKDGAKITVSGDTIVFTV